MVLGENLCRCLSVLSWKKCLLLKSSSLAFLVLFSCAVVALFVHLERTPASERLKHWDPNAAAFALGVNP